MTTYNPSLYFFLFLAFCVLSLTGLAVYIVRKTGDTKGLLDLAELVRAIRRRK